MKSILHLITGLNVGGAEMLLLNLVQRSNGNGFVHRVVSMLESGPVGDRLRGAGIRVESLGMHRGVPSLSGLFRLVRILKRSRVDVVCCWMYHANLFGLLAGRMAGVRPMVWSIHSAEPALWNFWSRTGWVIRAGAWFSQAPDCLVFNSREALRLHEAHGYDTAKATLLPSGFDVDRFKPDAATRDAVRSDLGLDHRTILIGMIARWHPVKDHANLLRAAEHVVRSKPDVHFLLVGDGVVSENPALQRLVHEHGLEGHMHLLGLRYDVPRLAAALDVACLSSRSESFPNTVGESMACGIPCVVTDTGTAREVVGGTGRVVPVRNSEALAKALLEIVRLNATERRALGQRARERIEQHFPLSRFVANYEELLGRLIAAAGSQRRGSPSL